MKHLLYILCLFVLSCDSGGSGVVHGCIDSQACNYNPNATLDNNSCEYDCEDIFCDPVGTITGYGDCDGSDDSDDNYTGDEYTGDEGTACAVNPVGIWEFSYFSLNFSEECYCPEGPQGCLFNGSFLDAVSCVDIAIVGGNIYTDMSECNPDCIQQFQVNWIPPNRDVCDGMYDECGVCDGPGATIECSYIGSDGTPVVTYWCTQAECEEYLLALEDCYTYESYTCTDNIISTSDCDWSVNGDMMITSYEQSIEDFISDFGLLLSGSEDFEEAASYFGSECVVEISASLTRY